MRNLFGPARLGLSLLLFAVSSIPGSVAVHEIDLSLNADALRLAYATEVGARYLSADYADRPSIKFDTGLHAGLNLRF